MTLVSVLTSLLLSLLCFYEYGWVRSRKSLLVSLKGLHPPNCTRHKPYFISPRASSSVSASVIYLKSMHDTICFGSWIDTRKTRYFPRDHDRDTNQTSIFSCDSPCQQAASRAATGKDDNRLVSHKVSYIHGVCLIMPDSPTLPSALAHRSHTAFRTAAVAKWITPFSGPNWFKSLKSQKWVQHHK